jgi:flagellar protein FlgJ
VNGIRGAGPAGQPFLPIQTPTADRVDAETLNESAQAKSLQPQIDTRNPKVLKAAQMYESQFLRYMLTEMRKTVPESEFMAPNQAEKIFKEQLDDQYVDNWVEKGGVGMSDMIYNQIMERFAPFLGKDGATGPQGGAHHTGPRGASHQPQGPRPTAPVEANKMKSQAVGKTLQFNLLPPEAQGADAQTQPILSPWAGKISDSRQLDKQSLVRIDHENGLQSLMQFDGVMVKQPGESVSQGEKLGQLAPSTRPFIWRINS